MNSSSNDPPRVPSSFLPQFGKNRVSETVADRIKDGTKDNTILFLRGQVEERERQVQELYETLTQVKYIYESQVHALIECINTSGAVPSEAAREIIAEYTERMVAKAKSLPSENHEPTVG